MEHSHPGMGTATATWWKRENLWPGLALVILTAIAWAYTLSAPGRMMGMEMPAATEAVEGMEMPDGEMGNMPGMQPAATLVRPADLALFLSGWAVMMIAMMLPAALPLLLLYRTIARKRLGAREAAAGLAALLAGYVGVWMLAGLPVYVYNLFSGVNGAPMAVLPGLLLIGGGAYQFTALKQGCHTRCSNPLFFLMQRWRPGVVGAARLGVIHGVDCLGCCAGLMVALVALGMMNVAWMLTAAVIIFVEKTLPQGHRIARPLGILLIAGGVVAIGVSLIAGTMSM